MAKTPWLKAFLIVLLSLCFGCGGPDVGVTSEEILIGTWTPLTGPASNLSVIARGMEAHFDYVNAQGGIHGRRVRLIIKDDGYDPARTPEVVKELIEGEERVFALVGGNGTANCMAVHEYITQRFVPWINPGSAARSLTSPVNAYVFSTYPSYVTEGRILARYAVEELGAEKLGLFHQDDSFGREGQEGVRLALRRANKEIDVVVPYSVGDTDLASVAQQFKDAEVDAIFIWAITEGAAALIEALDEIEDYDPQILATQVLADPVMFDLAGESWEGAIVASGVPETTSDEPGVQRAREIIEQHGNGLEFGNYAMMGLVRAGVLIEGLKRAGPELTRLGLIQALEKMEAWDDNILGTPITFTQDEHLGLNAVHLMKAEGGTYVHLTDWLEN